MTFSKILIANRGEIACRVIRTARRMGIATVAVHSDADRDALHVRLADQPVAIGPAPAAQSYLSIDRIVAAARDSGAEAVHPGYGFLSENPDFPRALAAAGIVFIGPPPEAMERLGDKIAAKKLAASHGVSTVPGHPDAVASEGEALRVAKAVGWPVIIKASAGGGGKGMRIAHDAGELKDGLRLARSEAKSSFGDDRVFIEKYVAEPRHIEIQVLGDQHGNVVHLFERECSIQRRHQKVIEEAPSPFLDNATRAAMGAQAVALAKAAGYFSAGTVEFIVDRDRNFYFLEMNTRLQVEHPVTEAVTGLDLVELMIRVAAGERLPLDQASLEPRGWAIEARVYAEDPARGFMPSIGRLTRYRPPATAEGVRIDDGVDEGGEISIHYDPMIAKVIGQGPDRATAARRLAEALDAFELAGVQHNIPFLASLIRHPRFAEGRLSTAFIAEEFPDGWAPRQPEPATLRRLIAVAATVHRAYAGRAAHGNAATSWVARMGGASIAVDLAAATVTIGGHAVAVGSAWQIGDRLFDGVVDGERMIVQLERLEFGYRLSHAGIRLDLAILSPRAAALVELMPAKAAPDTSKYLLSPMPGLLVSLAVKVGDAVRAGQELALVEAMKMENILRAERDGTVAALHAQPGDSLAVDQRILEFA